MIHKNGHTVGTLNKLKETKLNNNKKSKPKKEFIPPTLQEVQNYVLERNLNVNAEYFYNYFTEGKWIDSKGNKVKNWKQKMLTWNGYSSKKTENKTKKDNIEEWLNGTN